MRAAGSLTLDFRAAIFDLDGTLIDSIGLWEKIDVDFLWQRGFPLPEGYMAEIAARSFVEAAEYTIRLFGLSESPQELMDEWNAMALHEYGHNVRLKPHAGEYLRKLKGLGVKLATATSLPAVLSEPALKNNGVYELFDVHCSTDEVNRSKEHPDVFYRAAEKLLLPPADCIVFEDLLAGVISAKRAGMRTFCVYDKASEIHAAELRRLADGYLCDFAAAPLPAHAGAPLSASGT